MRLALAARPFEPRSTSSIPARVTFSIASTPASSGKRGVGKSLDFFDQTRVLSKPESGPPIPVPPEPD
ncbi:hypothetical protein H4582DRAFT_2080417 [Lactarius indigo]|nr:hypothetical protein H4582DRAFT_2080417 [Lactarius indigo]